MTALAQGEGYGPTGSPPGGWTPISNDLNRGASLKQVLSLAPSSKKPAEFKTAGDWFTGDNIFSKEFLKNAVSQAEAARLEAHGGHVYGYLATIPSGGKPLAVDAKGGAIPIGVYERGAHDGAQQMRQYGVTTAGTSLRDAQTQMMLSQHDSSARAHLVQQAFGSGAVGRVNASATGGQTVTLTVPGYEVSSGVGAGAPRVPDPDPWKEWTAKHPPPGLSTGPAEVPPTGGDDPVDPWGRNPRDHQADRVGQADRVDQEVQEAQEGRAGQEVEVVDHRHRLRVHQEATTLLWEPIELPIQA